MDMVKILQISQTAPHTGWLWALSIQYLKEPHGFITKSLGAGGQRTSGSTGALRSVEGKTELSGKLPNTSVPSCCVLLTLSAGIANPL